MVKVKKDMSAYRIPNTDFLSFKFESPDVSDPDIDALFLLKGFLIFLAVIVQMRGSTITVGC